MKDNQTTFIVASFCVLITGIVLFFLFKGKKSVKNLENDFSNEAVIKKIYKLLQQLEDNIFDGFVAYHLINMANEKHLPISKLQEEYGPGRTLPVIHWEKIIDKLNQNEYNVLNQITNEYIGGDSSDNIKQYSESFEDYINKKANIKAKEILNSKLSQIKGK